MPNKISLEECQQCLPAFVKIIPETYRGMRYKCRFLDTEFNEEFEGVPGAVVKLKYGCKTRTGERRSAGSRRGGPGAKVPLEEIKSRLPPYIQIVDASYQGIREKAKFVDVEFNHCFEACVCNVLRHKTAYNYPERRRRAFVKAVSVPVKEITERIEKLYNGEIQLVVDSYKNTNSSATFKYANGSTFVAGMGNALAGKLGKWRQILGDWIGYIRVTGGYKCFVCKSGGTTAHHLFCWSLYPWLRFDKENGVCLCKKCHDSYHTYDKQGTLETFNQWLETRGVGPLASPPLELRAKQSISLLLQGGPASEH